LGLLAHSPKLKLGTIVCVLDSTLQRRKLFGNW
jgi:hypothetical protein